MCHGEDGGGAIMEQDRLIGTMADPNLTSGRGSRGAQRVDIDYVRAITRGVRHDGTSFIVMPSERKRPDGGMLDVFMPWTVFGKMTDADLHALWLYLRSVPAKEFGNK
jgi:hypothetical protein